MRDGGGFISCANRSHFLPHFCLSPLQTPKRARAFPLIQFQTEVKFKSTSRKPPTTVTGLSLVSCSEARDLRMREEYISGSLH